MTKRFKKLLDEGISSVAKRQEKTIGAVQMEIAQELGYSVHTIEHWRRGNIPKTSELVEGLVRYCIKKGRVDVTWAKSLLAQAHYPNVGPLLEELFNEEKTQTTHIFMCYERDLEPDEALVMELSRALSRHYNVFFDQANAIDPFWVEQVKTVLSQSDFLIIFLSAESIHSEVVLSELEMAYNLRKLRGGRPVILPVRIAYSTLFPEPVSTYLHQVNWTYWENDEDTSRLIEELEKAISGGDLSLSEPLLGRWLQKNEPPPPYQPLPQDLSASLEMPEGTMGAQSPFYIERQEDRIALEAIGGQGVTITIKGPRQMGKSSLLVRIGEVAKASEKQVAFLDFQLLKSSLTDAETFFRQFCTSLTYKLGLDDQVETYWSLPLANSFRCTEYISRYLLTTLNCPLVLAIDEADSIFDTDFRTDFFGMLRTWHNNRALEPIWRNLDLVLVTSTEPYYFINNLNQSPFNVGEVIELQDFTMGQVAELNARYDSPLTSDQEAQLMALLNGHPYLVRRALYLVANRRLNTSDLFKQATSDRGPFGSHLRSLLFRLHGKTELLQGLSQVVHDHVCSDEQIFFRLRGAGLVGKDRGVVVPRCQLYADFFWNISMIKSSIYTVGGTVQAASGLYIRRQADEALLNICREGIFAYILTARQMGKSSLVVHTAQRLADEGICSVIVDVTELGAQASVDEWYFGFLYRITKRLELKTDLIKWWKTNAHLSVTQRLTLFFEKTVLTETSASVVILLMRLIAPLVYLSETIFCGPASLL